MMLKCCWNDLKINRSAGFQNADLTKVALRNGTGRWKGNRKGIDETSHFEINWPLVMLLTGTNYDLPQIYLLY